MDSEYETGERGGLTGKLFDSLTTKAALAKLNCPRSALSCILGVNELYGMSNTKLLLSGYAVILGSLNNVSQLSGGHVENPRTESVGCDECT